MYYFKRMRDQVTSSSLAQQWEGSHCSLAVIKFLQFGQKTKQKKPMDYKAKHTKLGSSKKKLVSWALFSSILCNVSRRSEREVTMRETSHIANVTASATYWHRNPPTT